jgi:hypothetical protein
VNSARTNTAFRGVPAAENNVPFCGNGALRMWREIPIWSSSCKGDKVGQSITRSRQTIVTLAPQGRVASRWRSYLETAFTAFGRLVYLGSLLNPRSGAIVHEGLELRCGKDGARELIRDAYAQALEVWLSYDVMQQEREIRSHFAALEINETSHARPETLTSGGQDSVTEHTHKPVN